MEEIRVLQEDPGLNSPLPARGDTKEAGTGWERRSLCRRRQNSGARLLSRGALQTERRGEGGNSNNWSY